VRHRYLDDDVPHLPGDPDQRRAAFARHARRYRARGRPREGRSRGGRQRRRHQRRRYDRQEVARSARHARARSPIRRRCEDHRHAEPRDARQRLHSAERQDMKVIIADDHPVVRQGLRQMLAAEADLSVVGEAKNGQEVVELSRKVPWEVAVLDYNMPGKSGLELIKELRQRYPGRAVLILSMYPEDRYAVRALKAGAAGYLTKESAPEELVSAIRKVAGGGRYVTPTLGEKLALELEDNRGKPLHETLSDREYQVMWMIASGKTVRQIADELFLSPNTVSTHRTRILRKMNMKSNAELMHYAIAHHLVD